MNIAIVTNNSYVFKRLSLYLVNKLNGDNLNICIETQSIPLIKLLLFRIKKYGLIKGFDQFLFRIFDHLLLKHKYF